MDSQLRILISAIDNASDTIKGIGGSMDSMSTTSENAANVIKSSFDAIGVAALAAETAFLVAAGDAQVAETRLNTSIQDNIDVANAAAKGQGAFATELTFAKTQMDLAQNELNKMTSANSSAGTVSDATKDKLSNLTVTLSDQQAKLSILTGETVKAGTATENHNLAITKLEQSITKTQGSISTLTGKMTETGTATKYTADQIEAQQEKVDVLSSKYQVLAGRMTLVGQSASDVEAMFAPAITGGENLGFTVDQSTAALTKLESILGDPKEALLALSAAQNVARASGNDLSSTATLLGNAMATGMGRGLQSVGVFVKDGVGGIDVLNAAMDQTKNQASNFAQTVPGQMAVAWAKINAIFIDMGKLQLPGLTTILTFFNNLLTTIEGLASDMPGTTQKIKAMLDLIDSKTGVITFFKTTWNDIATTFKNSLQPALERLWTTLQPLMPFLLQLAGLLALDVVEALKLAIQTITILTAMFVDTVNAGLKVTSWITDVFVVAISGMIDWLKQAVQWVENLVTSMSKLGGGAIGKVGGAIGGAASGVGSFVSGAIGSVAKLFASGGIVTSPTLAIVGEAGPEAIIPLSAFNGGPSLASAGGGFTGGGVTINITGNTLLSENVATQIVNMMLARYKRGVRL